MRFILKPTLLNKLFVFASVILIKLLIFACNLVKLLMFLLALNYVFAFIKTQNLSLLKDIAVTVCLFFYKEIIYLQLNEVTIINRITGTIIMDSYMNVRKVFKSIKNRKADYLSDRFIDGIESIPSKTQKDLILQFRNNYKCNTHNAIFNRISTRKPNWTFPYVLTKPKMVYTKLMLTTNPFRVFKNRYFKYLVEKSNNYVIEIDRNSI